MCEIPTGNDKITLPVNATAPVSRINLYRQVGENDDSSFR